MVLEAVKGAIALDEIVNSLFLDSFVGAKSVIGTYNFLSNLRLMWART